MSDMSQGDGWWEASDSKWYPQEEHPDYVDDRPLPPGLDANKSEGQMEGASPGIPVSTARPKSQRSRVLLVVIGVMTIALAA